MRMSEERIEKIARDVVDRLAEDELVDITVDEDQLAERIELVIAKDLAYEDVLQREAVEWLRQHKPHLDPGTHAWSIELGRKREDLAISKGYVLP
jgi:hypothetical protein